LVYWFFIILAIITSLVCFKKLTNKNIFNEEYNSFMLLIFIAFVGSFSISYIELLIMQYAKSGTFQWVKFEATQRWYGALLFGFLFVLIKYRNNTNIIDILNNACISVCLGIVVGKLGYFFDGHYGCYGVETNLPWGIVFKQSNGKAMHPIQLYDAIFHFILFFALLKFFNIKKISKYTFLLFFSATALYNFFVEFIRTNEKVIFNFTFAQFIYLIIILIVIVYFISIKTNLTKNNDIKIPKNR